MTVTVDSVPLACEDEALFALDSLTFWAMNTESFTLSSEVGST